MEHAVFGAYMVIMRCPVLQVVAVAVCLEVLPLGGHLRGSPCKNVFRF